MNQAMHKNDSLEEIILEEPIVFSGNPFIESLRSLGTDQAISGVINIGATALAGQFGMGTILKSAAGPITEKIGFFPAHVYKALKVYKTTPEESREPLRHYIAQALKKGLNNGIIDFLVQDPLYASMMYVALTAWPEESPLLLSALFSVSSTIAASCVNVAIAEARYKLLQHSFKKLGFRKESYFESRFYIRHEAKPEMILDSLKARFQLDSMESRQYYDYYSAKTSLPEYSGRKSKIRLRKRQNGDGWLQSAQIVYTRPNRMAQKKPEQFSYFPIKKDKFYFPLNQEMPESIDSIADEDVRNELAKITRGKGQGTLYFERASAQREELLASVDTVYRNEDGIKDRGFYVVELKSWKNKELLSKAMRYIMLNFPVIQVTKGKLELSEQLNGA